MTELNELSLTKITEILTLYPIEWERHRRHDQSINLVKAWTSRFTYEQEDLINSSPAQTKFQEVQAWLRLVEVRQPIRSRQAAALALAQADVLFGNPIID